MHTHSLILRSEYLQTEPFWWPQTDGFPLSHIHNQRLGGQWYPSQCRKSHELHDGAEEPVDKNQRTFRAAYTACWEDGV